MKSTRRLGRGLSTFLDFAPAGEDGAAHVYDVIAAPGGSDILKTSTHVAPPAKCTPRPRSTAQPPSAAASPRSSPTTAAPSARPASPAPRPVQEEIPFVDDVVFEVTLSEVVPVPPPPAPSRVVLPPEPPASRAPSPTPVSRLPAVEEEFLFVDEVIDLSDDASPQPASLATARAADVAPPAPDPTPAPVEQAPEPPVADESAGFIDDVIDVTFPDIELE